MSSTKTTITLLVLIVLASMWTSGRLEKLFKAMTVTK